MKLMKQEARRARNKAAKKTKAAARAKALATPTLDFPVEKSIPSLAWLGGKQYPHAAPRKTRPGNKDLHEASFSEDASRTFAKEVDKILNPPPVEETAGQQIPVVPMDAAPEVATI